MFKYPIGNLTKEVIKSFLLERSEDFPDGVEKPESEMTEEEKEEKKKEEEAKKKALEDQEKIDASPFKKDGEEKPDYTKDFKEKLKNLGVTITSGEETEPIAPPQKSKDDVKTRSEKIAAELGVGGHKAGKGSGGKGFGVGVHPGIKDVPASESEPTPAGAFNADVLLGASKDTIGDQFSTLVMQPYKELQYIKLQKSILPGIALKAQGFADVVGAGDSLSKSTGSGKKDFIAVSQAKAARQQQRIKATITDPGSLSVEDKKQKLRDIGGDKNLLDQLDNDTLSDFYDNTYKTLNTQLSDSTSGASALDKNIQRATKELAGMGGLDPFFAQELSAKLRGGEWVETMTREIGPSQERGVMSSMGSRRTAVSGF